MTNTYSTDTSKPLTIETLLEAKALIEALAPKQAPPGVGVIQFGAELKVMKSDLIPSGTIIVSKDLFDKLFECAEQVEPCKSPIINSCDR